MINPNAPNDRYTNMNKLASLYDIMAYACMTHKPTPGEKQLISELADILKERAIAAGEITRERFTQLGGYHD